MTKTFSLLWGLTLAIFALLLIGRLGMPVTEIAIIPIGMIFFFWTIYQAKRAAKEAKNVNLAVGYYIDNYTLSKYFPGLWQLTYSANNIVSKEIVEIKFGNQYYADGAYKFTLVNLKVNADANQISFEKHIPSGKYSMEILTITDESHLNGSDSFNFNLKYERIS